jgi:hypothetical protein
MVHRREPLVPCARPHLHERHRLLSSTLFCGRVHLHRRRRLRPRRLLRSRNLPRQRRRQMRPASTVQHARLRDHEAARPCLFRVRLRDVSAMRCVMRTWLLSSLLLCCLLAGCSSSTTQKPPIADGSSDDAFSATDGPSSSGGPCMSNSDCKPMEWCTGVSHLCPGAGRIFTVGTGMCHRNCFGNACMCSVDLDCGPGGTCNQGVCRGSGAGACALPPPCNSAGCSVQHPSDLICSVCVCAMCP